MVGQPALQPGPNVEVELVVGGDGGRPIHKLRAGRGDRQLSRAIAAEAKPTIHEHAYSVIAPIHEAQQAGCDLVLTYAKGAGSRGGAVLNHAQIVVPEAVGGIERP